MSSLYRGESFPMPQTPSLYREESALFLHKAESGPLLHVEEADSFPVQGRSLCSLHIGESVPPPYVEKADSFSVQRRESPLSTEDRVPLCYM